MAPSTMQEANMTTDNQTVVGWASASAVACRTVACLRALVARGELEAGRDGRNRHLFKRADLEALRPADLPEPGQQAGQPGTEPTRDGELAARVIEDLEAGHSLPDIAVRHRVAPDVLMQMHDQWRRLHEADLNAPSVPKELADLTRAVVELHEQLAAIEEAADSLREEIAALPVIQIVEHECDGDDAPVVHLAGRCLACGEGVAVVLLGRE